ncbi:granulin domain-containing protein [Cavenderia fasciculata]|uniref:Granulin domain-containing protein n=1 Tax=Cavenderia fasciculata TaxID=261658 RepID=F4PIQ0_CACFS|nr:granulin domain-containing protein [Cavenderia fasciculata]EGG24629.1 granulin domain-containing protein [Cavenderia fasciculata]|eukprot:XP_004362480.1 granulin domain-containing protein [Cavenderia fasciculata]
MSFKRINFVFVLVVLVVIMMTTVQATNTPTVTTFVKASTSHQLSRSMNNIIEKQPNVQCQDGSFCPAGNTCCPSANAGYSCCPANNAVCCKDLQHCCPQNFSCSSGGKICIPNSRWITSEN